MSATTERVGIVLGPDGTLRFQDLSTSLLPLAHEFGWQARGSARATQGTPAHQRTEQQLIPVSALELRVLPRNLLWKAHDANPGGRAGSASKLDLKRELAWRLMAPCNLCEWRCGVDRLAGQIGRCGSGARSRISRAFMNWGEERRVAPGFTIYFSGCNWTCPYCQYPQELDADRGKPLDPVVTALVVGEAALRGARTLHFLGGNPDQHLSAALDLVAASQAGLEVVWNSNGYASTETMKLLEGVVDVWLLDLRYANNSCAALLGAGPRTWETVTRNIKLAADSDADVIVRHLQLPGHWSCCTEPILYWLAAELNSTKVQLNLMRGQYWPAHRAHTVPGLGQCLPRQDYERACDLAHRLGLRLVDDEQGEVEDV